MVFNSYTTNMNKAIEGVVTFYKSNRGRKAKDKKL